MRGWALTKQEHIAEGLIQLHQGLDAVREMGIQVFRPYHLALLAESYARNKQPEAGLTTLDEAPAVGETSGERFYEAELRRLQGVLLLQQSADHAGEAETCFRQALDIARQQQAKSLELRAAASLARLWQSQGKRREARDLLALVYAWFTEGFDTADLKDAQTLLEI